MKVPYFIQIVLWQIVCFPVLMTSGQNTEDTLTIDQLAPIPITASRVSGTTNSTPLSISVLSKPFLQQGQQQLSINESLDALPGVFALNPDNFAQDLRIAIRGFGARAAFGIRGIKLIVDGIPESTPDGQAQVDNLDIGILDKVEVIRGPSSGLFGNAAGGVINISTELAPKEPFVEARLSWGSFNFQRYQLKAGIQKGTVNSLVYLSRTQTDGFRNQSAMENTLVNGRIQWDIDSTTQLGFFINYVNSPVGDDPGGIDADAVEADREQARDRNLLFQTGESVEQGRIALSFSKKIGPKHQFQGRAYYLIRAFEGRLPFEFGGLVDLDRDYVGGGISYTFNGKLASKRYRLQAGVDIDYQRDDRRRFNNLEGIKGEQTLAQDEIFSNIGIYAIQEFFPSSRLTFTLGTRLDIIQIEAEDRFLLDEDQSGQLDFNRFNPTFGGSYEWKQGQFVFGNISTSFESPALSELSANPAGLGGFNSELEPQKALNLEVGIKGYLRSRFRYEVALFHIQLRDELVPFELPDFPDRTFFRNAGESQRSGLELNLQYQLTRHLTTQVSYTYSNFEYSDYELNGENLEGNQIPGIPRHFTYLGLRYQHPSGFYGRAWNRWVGSMFANDTNTTEIDAYSVTNFRIGFEKPFNRGLISPFFGINNIFDAEYSGNIRINAFGGRFFEPAPGIHIYGGVKFTLQ